MVTALREVSAGSREAGAGPERREQHARGPTRTMLRDARRDRRGDRARRSSLFSTSGSPVSREHTTARRGWRLVALLITLVVAFLFAAVSSWAVATISITPVSGMTLTTLIVSAVLLEPDGAPRDGWHARRSSHRRCGVHGALDDRDRSSRSSRRGTGRAPRRAGSSSRSSRGRCSRRSP